MGLFGLFATLFGLGAMAKDGVENYFISESEKEKAIRNGDLTYYSNGKFEKVYAPKGTLTKEVKDPVTGHIYDTNYKTGERLIDLTEYYNNQIIQKERRECSLNGTAFYRTPIFDVPEGMNKRAMTGGETSPVYVSDKIPGYFEKRYTSLENLSRWPSLTVYVKGNLIPHFGDAKRKEVNGPRLNKDNADSVEAYFEDGTRVSKREFARRTNEFLKQRLINSRMRYSICSVFYEARDEETYEIINKSLNDDRIYKCMSYGYDKYYVEARVELGEKYGRPHYYLVPIDGAVIYNEDGTISTRKITDFKM